MRRHRTIHIAALLLACANPLACAEDLSEVSEGGEGGETGDSEDGKILHSAADGATMSVVDSTDEELWVYLDLDVAAAGGPSGELEEGEEGWDFGLRRFEIKLNGGVHGDAAVAIGYREGLGFEGVDAPPQDLAWISDGETEDEEGEPVLALGDWYDYDVMNHTLSPKDRTYFVRTSEAAIYKFRIVDYYSEAGSPGHIGLLWAPLDGA